MPCQATVKSIWGTPEHLQDWESYTLLLWAPEYWTLKQQIADEDNDDVIESFWLYIFSVFPSFVYYYLEQIDSWIIFYGFSEFLSTLVLYFRITSF